MKPVTHIGIAVWLLVALFYVSCGGVQPPSIEEDVSAVTLTLSYPAPVGVRWVHSVDGQPFEKYTARVVKSDNDPSLIFSIDSMEVLKTDGLSEEEKKLLASMKDLGISHRLTITPDGEFLKADEGVSFEMLGCIPNPGAFDEAMRDGLLAATKKPGGLEKFNGNVRTALWLFLGDLWRNARLKGQGIYRKTIPYTIDLGGEYLILDTLISIWLKTRPGDEETLSIGFSFEVTHPALFLKVNQMRIQEMIDKISKEDTLSMVVEGEALLWRKTGLPLKVATTEEYRVNAEEESFPLGRVTHGFAYEWFPLTPVTPVQMEWVFDPNAKVRFTKTEITVAQYRACVEAGGCPKGSDHAVADVLCLCNRRFADNENHPMNCVDWHDANAFCAWQGARLPTFEEWLAAGRQGQDKQRSPDKCRYGNVSGCGTLRSAPVCETAAAEDVSHLCDLLGNVAEWVAHTPREGRTAYDSRYFAGSGFHELATTGGLGIEFNWNNGRPGWSPPRGSSAIGFRCAKPEEGDAAPPDKGWLEVETSISGPEVSLDGAPLSSNGKPVRTPVLSIDLEEGAHRVSVKHHCFDGIERQVEIENGRKTSLFLEMSPKKSTLVVAPVDRAGKSLPATVRLDGKAVEATPLTDGGLRIVYERCKHQNLTVAAKGYRVYSQTLPVPDGKGTLSPVLEKANEKDENPSPDEYRHSAQEIVWMRCPMGETHRRKGCTGKAATMTWEEALEGCPVGYRLPTQTEADRLLAGCSILTECAKSFAKELTGEFWTATVHPDNAQLVHRGSFQTLLTPAMSITTPASVLCVRDLK